MRTNLKIAAIILLVIFYLSFGIHSSTSMPSNAIVYVNDHTKEYIAPPGIEKQNKSLRKTTVEEARNLGYSPNEKSRNEGMLSSEGRSVGGKILEYIGVLSPLPSRWNKDGTWNW